MISNSVTSRSKYFTGVNLQYLSAKTVANPQLCLYHQKSPLVYISSQQVESSTAPFTLSLTEAA